MRDLRLKMKVVFREKDWGTILDITPNYDCRTPGCHDEFHYVIRFDGERTLGPPLHGASFLSGYEWLAMKTEREIAQQ